MSNVLGKCLEGADIEAMIERDMAEGGRLGVTGIPTTLVNGSKVRGSHPVEVFEGLVETVGATSVAVSSRNVRFCRSEVDGADGGLPGDGGCSRRACGLALAAIWVVAHLWGCGTGKPDGPEEAAVVVRDSAGLRLVEFDLDVWDHRPVWFVSATPGAELRPGMAGESTAGGDSAYEFFGVSGLERLSTGEIVVAMVGPRSYACLAPKALLAHAR